MKKRWTMWSLICCTGIPWLIIFMAIGVYVQRWIYHETTGRQLKIHSLGDIKLVVIYSLIAWLIVVLRTSSHIGTGKRIGLFTWLSSDNVRIPDDPYKRQAQYPEIPAELLSDKPDGLVLAAKQRGTYIRVPLKKGNILNAIIMGAPGCGKSVLLLTMLIFQLNRAKLEKSNEEPMVFYVQDIKPELAIKSSFIKDNDMVHVMDPQDRFSYGWNPFFELTPESSDDKVMEVLDLIVRSQIDPGESDRNIFFYHSAQNCAKGILFYTIRRGMNLSEGMDYLMDGSLEDVIARTLKAVGDRREFKVVRALLSPYAGKKGEAMESIEVTMRENLAVFLTQDIHYFFGENPKKACPLDLEQKISVFFSLKETKLEEYETILRLVSMQVMRHCSGRPEDSHMITLVLDEAARLGAVDYLSFLATSRSRQVATILCFQGFSQMQALWGRDKAKSLLELCRVVEVLSCADTETVKVLSEWTGFYKTRRMSMTGGPKSDGSYTVSYEEKPVLQTEDMMSLQDLKEAVFFVKGRYYRADVDGARYFNIPPLNEISKGCKAANSKDKAIETATDSPIMVEDKEVHYEYDN